MKILLTGGGTMGSVTPLTAIIEELKSEKCKDALKCVAVNFQFLWIGTRRGPEREFVEWQGLKFKGIFSGKFRRYFSLRNFIDPLFILFGFFQSLFIILKFKPDIVLSAGSFVSVPVVFAGKILGVPILIHQMDVRAGLANKVMAPLATKITVGFEKSLSDYPKEKTIWTGNPIRKSTEKTIISRSEIEDAREFFNLEDKIPTVLIVGGGTGSEAINMLIEESIEDLVRFCQIIHVTGKGKYVELARPVGRYHGFEFLPEIYKAYAVSDVVISRGGLGILSELSALGKPSILIPMPKTHQEDNVDIFVKNNGAIVLNQKDLSTDIFIENIKKIVYNKELRDDLGKNIKKLSKEGAAREILRIILQITKSK